MTIKEIAKLADVSTGTVSYVINKKGRVSAEVRERIWKIMLENGYTPNKSARDLVTGKNPQVAIMIPNTGYLKSSIFFNHIAAAVIERLSVRNMSLVILVKENSFENWTKNAIGVDGVIFINPESGDVCLEWLASSHIPFAVIGRYENGIADCPGTDADTEGIAYEATKLLWLKGHRKILYNLGFESYTLTEDQKKGIARALNECGADKNAASFIYSPYQADDKLEAFAQAFDMDPDITAVVTSADSQALGAKVQLQNLGLAIPTDVSLVCLSGTYLTQNMMPRISSFYTSYEDMGHSVADQLIQMLDKKPVASAHVKLGYQFDLGGSIAPKI